MNLKCVLFDLDGTLLDTSYDFSYAINQVCIEQKQPLVNYQSLRAIVSQGGQAMVELAFPEHSPEQIETLKQRFLEIYFDNIAHHTQLFPGLDVTMEYLAKYNIPWGIVTNKPQKLTQQLLTHFDFPSPPKTVISGDTFDVRKPHPKPLLMASKDCRIAPNECLYLGDHPRDIEAGKNAKMITGAALYGYIPPSENSEQWSADHYFATPHDINLFIQNQLKSE